MQDVIVIGAGIVGVSAARELSKYELNILVLEKCSDLTEGTTKANSGIVHGGYDCQPNTLKAKLNVEGNKMFETLSQELDFPFRRNGSLVLAFSEQQAASLEQLIEKGRANGVTDLSILNKEQVLAMEKNINPEVVKALYAPSGGITSPYKACIAIAESAAINGVQFEFNTKVNDIQRKKVDDIDCYLVKTNRGDYLTKTIVNAAGLYSDVMNNFVSSKTYTIVPRKGEYTLFDKSMEGFVDKTIFQLPNEFGKGVLVTPTMDGNLMTGPTAEDIDDKGDKGTHADAINKVLQTAKLSVPNLPMNQIITSFVGLRAHLPDTYDFVIEEAEGAKGFINAIGIESPGLSAAPAIGVYITELLQPVLEPKLNHNFIKERKGITTFRKLSLEQQNALIKADSTYGKIVCRCESITEGEIIEAINRPLGATTIDGVKRRTRAGFGRCQGGFCSSKVMEIIAREKHIKVSDVTKFGGQSKIIIGE